MSAKTSTGFLCCELLEPYEGENEAGEGHIKGYRRELLTTPKDDVEHHAPPPTGAGQFDQFFIWRVLSKPFLRGKGGERGGRSQKDKVRVKDRPAVKIPEIPTEPIRIPAVGAPGKTNLF